MIQLIRMELVMKMNKTNKLFQGLTLLARDNLNDIVWATYEEIPGYIEQGYEILNEKKREVWNKIAK